LAALSLQDHPEPTAFIQSFTGSNQYILDYLLEEVLQHQPPHIQTFLMQTAVLTRLSGSLCNAVVDQDDSQEILEQLQQSNLFIMSLDDTREWFRYHHLFADLLIHRLRRTQPDHIVNLHNRASQWYEENGFITDALHHAHAVADYDRATQLIVAHAWQKMSNGEPNTVASWINAMPSEQVHTHPFLAISKAWNLLYLMQFQKIEPYLISASQLLNDSDSGTEYQYLHGELFAIQARIAHYQGNSPQAIQLAHQALECLKIENTFVRGLVLTVLGDALRDEEKIEAAISAYTDALEIGQAAGDSLVLMGVAYRLGDLYAECGKLQQAESLLQNVLNRFPSDLPATGF
ncbi:MAG: hypothetical protein GY943_07950, partial [Chloroflexi bacterium]|nr:hypothetical protein [Chloroflexota bacterium]